MNYSQAEQFLYSLSNLPRKEYMRDPRACSIYLKRTQLLLDCFGNPEKRIPHVVHIAGTSGKGSVAQFLQSILVADKKKTGLFVSPHPTTITERWWIGNKKMSKKTFVKVIQELKKALDRYTQKNLYSIPSFFEITTVLGLYWFAEQACDWVILETGCGGKYDSTNIIPHKDLAIVTNIGLDHTHILGNTKQKIAHAKAGIIKHAKKAITQEQNKLVRAIIEKEAKKNRIPLSFSKKIASIVEQSAHETIFMYENRIYKITAPGAHQVHNATLAIDAAKQLSITHQSTVEGLAHAVQPLRMEVVDTAPTILLDGAHNVDKMRTTIETIQHTPYAKKRIHLIVGFCENKNSNKMIQLLSTLQPYSVSCTRNTVNPYRKVTDPADIESTFKKQYKQTKTKAFLDPKEALAWTKKQAKKQDLILITGSLFLSGELRPYLTV